ncbi:MAG: YjbH domain-containing protein [Candidatus Cloacimonadota bacterium]|nr:YjbH domain-containing protein [Candidatus Cloacimonadota bacterium]
MRKLSILFILLIISISVFAFELNTLIDIPTAGILQQGEAEITAKIYKDNGLLIGTRVGLFPRFMFGVNYGAEEIVGDENPQWHDRVEFNAKVRLMDENNQLPAIAIGYDSQGHGRYDKSQKRYDIKSKGVYLTVSKNFFLFGNIGVHGGINYSLETEDKDDEPNLFVGFDKTIGDMIVLLAEYDTGWNDNEASLIKGRGFFNASVDLHFTEALIIKISFYDLLLNHPDTQGCDRSITLIYNMTF